eukprot:TRINITY_DN52681_c0_g1_i1.p1 TRINITY_DN52681_c0_g1~~TRINITY_DN52681_c0_g1_i1.p1  ORF type:complete len:392 (-),score=67.63 TRINITY_DN52681_c0_g1_i1:13-1188(-)
MQLSVDGAVPDLSAHLDALTSWQQRPCQPKKPRLSKPVPSSAPNTSPIRRAVPSCAPVNASSASPWESVDEEETCTIPKARKHHAFPAENGSKPDNCREEMRVIRIPKSIVGKVIGETGSRLAAVATDTGAKVSASDPDKTTTFCPVVISGTKEAVINAEAIINNMILHEEVHPVDLYLEIPEANITKVIGKKRKQVKRIQEMCGVSIEVYRGSDPCRVRIRGEEEKVEDAERAIMGLATKGTVLQSDYWFFKKEAMGAIIGEGGSRLKQVHKQSGARVDIDKTHAASCCVRFLGTVNQIKAAKSLLISLIPMMYRTPESSSTGHTVQAERTTQGSPGFVVPADVHPQAHASSGDAPAAGVRAGVGKYAEALSPGLLTQEQKAALRVGSQP